MKEIICDPIEIKGACTRHEIVQKVVNIFITTEHQERGKGVRFYYPVEQLSTSLLPDTKGHQLFLFRPAGLRKWNFDFKVDVLPEYGLGKGTHEDIASDIRAKKQENPTGFAHLLLAINELYSCSETDVDKILESRSELMPVFKTGAPVEILLKVLKWMFIMEDIVYWNYEGRTKLHNYLTTI